MLDFFSSFAVLVVLFVLLLAGCFVFLITKIILSVINTEKRKANEQLIYNTADSINHLIEVKNINNAEELSKLVNLPKKMTLTKEENDFYIKYKNLTYNVNTGRFKLDLV
ncbi:MAG: hypothetical protein FWD28_09265 [Treponema sp.]|nr:hypothetical protein [Treponema sp.]